MKRLIVSAAIISALGLTGCGGETLEEIQQQTAVDKPFARVVFDPLSAEFSVPNDLAMLPQDLTSSFPFLDLTINTEPETSLNGADPTQALGALDGWSTHQGFVMNVDLPAGVDLDASSVSMPGAIRIFEATQALTYRGDEFAAECGAIASAIRAPGIPCVIGDELQFGVDFVTAYSGNGSISVLPLKAMKFNQGYVLALTDNVTDDQGRGIKGSTLWDLVAQDINTNPLATDIQLLLQAAINQFLALLDGKGVDQDSVVYTKYFSTVSVGQAEGAIKQVQAGGFGQAVVAKAQADAVDPATAVVSVIGDAIVAAATKAGEIAVTQDLAGETSVVRSVSSQIQGTQPIPVLVANPGLDFDHDSNAETAALNINNLFDFQSTNLLTLISAGAGGALPDAATLAGLGLDSCDGLAAGSASTNPLVKGAADAIIANSSGTCSVNYATGAVTLPYYLSKTNPLGDWWRAACTSGIMIQNLNAVSDQLIPGMVAAGLAGPNQATCSALGLADLQLDKLALVNPALSNMHDERHVTKFNPLPVANSMETLDVQISLPNSAIVGIEKPATGWPVVILMHGITSKKSDMIPLTITLANAGYATVAIDQPLHNSRGLMVGEQVVNATTGMGGSATDYMNLSSLLTSRDNIRQAAVDAVGLRFALNAFAHLADPMTRHLDSTKVFFVGHSIGGITGIDTVATANSPMSGALAPFNSMYSISASNFANAGGGVPGFLLESGSFGSTVVSQVLAGGSPDFRAALGLAATDPAPGPEVTVPALLAYEQTAVDASVLNQFLFASQTILDAADPNNTGAMLAMTPGLNTYLTQVAGDATIPNATQRPGLYGTEDMAAIMGLEQVSSTTAGNGFVKFTSGTHSTLLSGDVAAVQVEMHTQLVAYFNSVLAGTPTILISNTEVVE